MVLEGLGKVRGMVLGNVLRENSRRILEELGKVLGGILGEVRGMVLGGC